MQDVKVPAWLVGEADLRPGAKLLLALMLGEASGGRLVFASEAALAGRLGVSTAAVATALKQLRAAGAIELAVSQYGRGRPRGYRVLAGAPGLAEQGRAGTPPTPTIRSQRTAPEPEPRREGQLTLWADGADGKEVGSRAT